MAREDDAAEALRKTEEGAAVDVTNERRLLEEANAREPGS